LTVWLEKIEVNKNWPVVVTIVIFMTAFFVIFVANIMNFTIGFKAYGMAVNVAIIVAFLLAGSVTYGVVNSMESFVAGIVTFVVTALIVVVVVASPEVMQIAIKEAYGVGGTVMYGRDEEIMISGAYIGILGTVIFGVGFSVVGPVVGLSDVRRGGHFCKYRYAHGKMAR